MILSNTAYGESGTVSSSCMNSSPLMYQGDLIIQQD